MWKFVGGLVVAAIISSCATLNQSEIKSATHSLLEEQQLLPMLDFYGERIDIIRNKNDVRGGAVNEGAENTPYHDAGFYLGNGLFYDLNGNFCLLPWYPFYNMSEKFTISKQDKSSLFSPDFIFTKSDSLLSIESDNKIGFTKNYEILDRDSVITFIKGKLMKMEFQIKPNGNYFFKRALSNEDIRKTKDGFVIKKLLSKDFYTQKGNEITLADNILVKYQKNMIEIFEMGWSKPVLKYQMIVNNNSIIIYDTKFRGFKLDREGEKIIVYKNQKVQYIYEKQP